MLNRTVDEDLEREVANVRSKTRIALRSALLLAVAVVLLISGTEAGRGLLNLDENVAFMCRAAGLLLFMICVSPTDGKGWDRRLTSVPVLFSLVVSAIFVFMAEPLKLAMTPAAVREGQRLWTIFTSALAHADRDHLAGNVVGILLFGLALDLRIGRARTLLVLVASIAAASLTHAWFTTLPMTPTVGASGGAYGLIWCSFVIMPKRRGFWRAAGLPVSLPAFVLVPLFYGADLWIQATRMHRIAWLAHFGGALFGALLGLWLRRTKVPPEFARAEADRSVALARVTGG